jgi:hypothetical protein
MMPPMETKDIAKLSTAVQQVATSLAIAEEREWIDKETSRKIFAAITNFTGVEINLDTVAENIKKQEETKGYEDYLKRASFNPDRTGGTSENANRETGKTDQGATE